MVFSLFNAAANVHVIMLQSMLQSFYICDTFDSEFSFDA